MSAVAETRSRQPASEMAEPLPTLPVHALGPPPASTPWLVRELWGAAAVGVIGGPPKSCKSWLGLDLAVSVASATPCLGHFEVEMHGPALVYLAEDAPHDVKRRIAQLCAHRGLVLADLDLHVITAPSLRLDRTRDQRALDATLAALQPKLLLLDPLIRLHGLDENSAAEISTLLGFLRELNRRHELALLLVHHLAKRAHRDPGQALRGSGDIHAWYDSACYLVRHEPHLRLTVQHRAAPAPQPMLLSLAGGNGEPLHLQLDGHPTPPPPSLTVAVRELLRLAGVPLSRAELRKQLRVNNARLGHTLAQLEQHGLVTRTHSGWTLPPGPDPRQLNLID
jgi:hypothetical protein